MSFNAFKSPALALLVSTALLSGCTTNPNTGQSEASNAGIGAGLGAAGGAIIGLITGDNSKERRKNALIGAGIGAVAGGGVGYYMDQQEKKLRQDLASENVDIQRVGNDIILNMDQSITFASNSATPRSSSWDAIDTVANVLKEYEKTTVDVSGHTDSVGADSYNQQLSERRALSVADALTDRGILTQRVLIAGYGESRPIATNDTAEGRQTNRRVEIRLVPITDEIST